MAIAPIVLSLLCVVLVLQSAAKFCMPPVADEGTAAHLFAIAMLLQLPIVALFVARNRHRLVEILPTIALQVFAWAVAARTAMLLT